VVQILPRANPTFGEQVSSGLTSGIQQGADFGKMFAENVMKQKAQAADFSRKMGLADEYKKKFIEQGVNPQIAELLGVSRQTVNKHLKK